MLLIYVRKMLKKGKKLKFVMLIKEFVFFSNFQLPKTQRWHILISRKFYVCSYSFFRYSTATYVWWNREIGIGNLNFFRRGKLFSSLSIWMGRYDFLHFRQPNSLTRELLRSLVYVLCPDFPPMKIKRENSLIVNWCINFMPCQAF